MKNFNLFVVQINKLTAIDKKVVGLLTEPLSRHFSLSIHSKQCHEQIL